MQLAAAAYLSASTGSSRACPVAAATRSSIVLTSNTGDLGATSLSAARMLGTVASGSFAVRTNSIARRGLDCAYDMNTSGRAVESIVPKRTSAMMPTIVAPLSNWPW